MEIGKQDEQERIYRPALTIDTITIHHTFGRLDVTLLEEPEMLCGIAKRVGYTNREDTALALYRLKLKTQRQHVYVTLPSLFVVIRGAFLEYEQWLTEQR